MAKRILVAVDATEDSRRVGEFVNEFFEGTGVEIIALHVPPGYGAVLPPVAMFETTAWWGLSAEPPYALTREVTGEDREEAERSSEEVIEASGLHAHRTDIEFGDVLEAIEHVAEAEDVALIVVGASHRGLLDRLTSGPSVSRELARSSPRPVLIVH